MKGRNITKKYLFGPFKWISIFRRISFLLIVKKFLEYTEKPFSNIKCIEAGYEVMMHILIFNICSQFD